MIQCFHFKNQYLHCAKSWILCAVLTLWWKSLEKNFQGIHSLQKSGRGLGWRWKWRTEMSCFGSLSLPRPASVNRKWAESWERRALRDHGFLCRPFKKAASMKACLKSSEELERWLSPKPAFQANRGQESSLGTYLKTIAQQHTRVTSSVVWDWEIGWPLGLTGWPLVNGLVGSAGDPVFKTKVKAHVVGTGF